VAARGSGRFFLCNTADERNGASRDRLGNNPNSASEPCEDAPIVAGDLRTEEAISISSGDPDV